MDIQSIEQFVAGSDEINRQRKVITKVMSTLLSSISDTARKRRLGKKGWKSGERIFVVYIEGVGQIELVCHGDFVLFSPPRISHADDLYFMEVPLIYKALPKIVEAADVVVREACLKKLFNFFISQAPINKPQ